MSTPDTGVDGPGPDQRFRDFLAAGRFMLQRSRASGAYVFYPRVFEPGTGNTDLEWVEASGDGTVYSTTVVRQRPEKGGAYNVCLVDLAEGPRLMGRVVDVAPEDVRIGMKVKARIDEIGGTPAIVFTPAD